uniref:wound-induced protein 1-like n=1 Tax=Fragaria vesca subsp. vesca TaxID=101020 RepID=UPI0005C94D21
IPTWSPALYKLQNHIQLPHSKPPFPEHKASLQQLRVPELANPKECGLGGEANGDVESRNKRAVKSLYDAFNSKDVDVVHLLLAPYLEWWFHGPPTHQHLNRLLTGAPPYDSSFKFAPLSIVAFGSMVVAEGYDEGRSVSWVHAWTVTDGIITQVREYYNTSVTVTRLYSPEITSPSGSCQNVWESKLSDNKSVPGLVLAL